MNIATCEVGATTKNFDYCEVSFWVIRHQQAIADRLGIHLTDLKCLGVLHRKGPMTPKALAKEVAMSSAAMTTIIDRLERKKYVQRRREGGDRRSIMLHATGQSRKRVMQMYKFLGDEGRTLNSRYTAEDLKMILRYLDKVMVAVQAATSVLIDPH
jgi:DNA-binding MarR family transcriptional regulator